MKRTWQLINNVIHDNFGHSKSSSVDELSCDSSVLTDPVNIANKFNEYFTHICPNLAAKIPQVPGSHLDYVKTNVKKSMFIKPTTDFEIKKIISELHGSKSPGQDSLPAKIVKAVSEYICAPLCYMFNLSFVSGCFPDSLKLAKVIPCIKVRIKNLLLIID